MNINWTKLNKFIKRTESNIWGKKDGFNYVSNGHYMLRTKNLRSSTLSKLLDIFGNRTPNEGELLVNRSGDNVSEMEINFLEVIDNYKPNFDVIDTGLLQKSTTDEGKERMLKVFVIKTKHDRDYYYLNNEYCEIVKNLDEFKLRSNGRLNQLYAEDDDGNRIIILPIRVNFEEENPWLRKLEIKEV